MKEKSEKPPVGRPPLEEDERKKTFQISTKIKYMTALGGEQECKRIAQEHLEKQGKKKLRAK